MNHHALPENKHMICRTDEVTRLTGLSRTTLWRFECQGKFPARVRLGANSVGWREEEIRAWLDERPRGMPSGITHPQRTSR
jgi:prophage regulatory protein